MQPLFQVVSDSALLSLLKSLGALILKRLLVGNFNTVFGATDGGVLQGWLVDFGKDRPRQVLLQINAVLQGACCHEHLGRSFILLLELTRVRCLTGTEARLQCVYLDLECAQQLIQADLHPSCWYVRCLWQGQSLVDFLHGALQDHRERRLHVLDHVVFPQVFKPVKIRVRAAKLNLLDLGVLEPQLE